MINFASDNEAPMRPEILQALIAANSGPATAYGEDALTKQLNSRFSEVFDTDVAVYPVHTGTAANALALATITPAAGGIVCHHKAHINHHEAGAIEYATRARLFGMAGEQGKLRADELQQYMHYLAMQFYHGSQPSTLSITQATEAGAVYSAAEVSQLCAVAREFEAKVHMDGARFGHAVASTGASPAELSWRAGVDILSFGSTKNGTMNAEVVVDFHPGDPIAGKRRLKQAGQMASKQRFHSAQLLCYLDHWVNWADQCNQLAQQLAQRLQATGLEIAQPVQTNMVFVRMPPALALHLRLQHVAFRTWDEQTDLYRLALSNVSSLQDIDTLVALVQAWQAEN